MIRTSIVHGSIITTAAIFFISAHVFSSQGRTEQPKDKQLIWRAESPCSGSDCLQEKFLYWPDNLKDGDGAVFIRVCSDQPLLSAIANAAISPVEGAYWIETYFHFKPEQISFVRSDECTAKNSGIIATEFWWARSAESGPPWDNRITADQLKISNLGERPNDKRGLPFEGPANYVSSVRELIAELRSHPTAFGLVAGYYLDRPTRKMILATNVSKRMLEQSKVEQYRCQASLKKWPGGWTIAPPDPKPNRPTIKLFDINGDIRYPDSFSSQQNNNGIIDPLQTGYGDVNWNIEQGFLDDIGAQLKASPNSYFIAVFYAGPKACRGSAEARARRAMKFLARNWKITNRQFIWKDGGYREDGGVVMTMLPKMINPASLLSVSGYRPPKPEWNIKDCKGAKK